MHHCGSGTRLADRDSLVLTFYLTTTALVDIVTMADSSDDASNVNSMNQDQGPVPLSFPSILRNRGLTDRFAHLHASKPSPPTSLSTHPSKKARRRDDNDGKRWIKRKENGLSSPILIPVFCIQR